MRYVLPQYGNSQMDALINEYVHSERDRRILHRRLIDGICYEPLAEEVGMSPRQVKAIVNKSLKQIIPYL